MNSKDLSKFFCSTHNRRLSNIFRFNNTPRVAPETVADHSFYVAFNTNILCDFLSINKPDLKIDKVKALEMALLHDYEEIFSGDIVANMKDSSPKMRAEIDSINCEVIKTVFGNLMGNFGDRYVDIWEDSRGISNEAVICRAADFISALIYEVDECKMGNSFFKRMVYNNIALCRVLQKKYPNIFDPWFDVLVTEIANGAGIDISLIPEQPYSGGIGYQWDNKYQ